MKPIHLVLFVIVMGLLASMSSCTANYTLGKQDSVDYKLYRGVGLYQQIVPVLIPTRDSVFKIDDVVPVNEVGVYDANASTFVMIKEYKGIVKRPIRGR